METQSFLYEKSDIHNISGQEKQNKTSSMKEQFIQGKKGQSADNATEESKQKGDLAICCKKLKAKEDLSTKETENNVNVLEQFVPPAKRIKREEIGSLILKKATESQAQMVCDVGLDTGTFFEDGQTIKMINTITDLSSLPLGKTVGNVLEVAESMQYLQGNQLQDLMELVRYLGGQLLVTLKKASTLEQAYGMVDETLNDKKSDNSVIVKFKAMIEGEGQYYAKRLCDEDADIIEYSQKKVELSTLHTDIRIKEIKVEASEFPRYVYALNNMLDVVMRYKNVLQSNCIGQDGRYILFYICTTPENDGMTVDFLQEITKKGKIRDSGSLEQFVQSKDQSTVSCFITSVNYQHILTAIRNRTTMTFILGDTDMEEKSFQRCQNTYAIHINNAWEKVDLVLEKWLFQSLKPVCEVMGADIESHRLDKNASYREYKGKPMTDDEQANDTNVIIFLKKDILSTLKTETKDCLFEEIVGLFNMSDVSIDDIPNIPKYRSDLDLKEICRHLSSNFEGIIGVGCRMQKVQIAVKDGQSFSTVEKQKRLREILHDFKIYEYEIVPMSMKKYLTSGDEIAVGQGNSLRGSFGCFAKEDETENEATVMYGLFSKHLVPASEQLNVLHVMEGGELKIVGKVIDNTLEGVKLDIAAAALSIRKDECDTRFKTASGKQICGEKRIIEPKKLIGQKVHIWGAKSKPGRGIITVPEYNCEGEMDCTLILVEDIADGEGTVEKRFAQPGDSGAIACTDVPGQKSVIPISMIMGVMNPTEVDKDDKQDVKKQKGTHATVPLQGGLQQISERIGKQVELC